jgi:hypothetical protein
VRREGLEGRISTAGNFKHVRACRLLNTTKNKSSPMISKHALKQKLWDMFGIHITDEEINALFVECDPAGALALLGVRYSGAQRGRRRDCEQHLP